MCAMRSGLLGEPQRQIVILAPVESLAKAAERLHQRRTIDAQVRGIHLAQEALG